MSESQTQTETGINKDGFKRGLTSIDENCNISFQEGILTSSGLFPINRFGGIDKWLA
jgi:hypothetical protein